MPISPLSLDHLQRLARERPPEWFAVVDASTASRLRIQQTVRTAAVGESVRVFVGGIGDPEQGALNPSTAAPMLHDIEQLVNEIDAQRTEIGFTGAYGYAPLPGGRALAVLTFTREPPVRPEGGFRFAAGALAVVAAVELALLVGVAALAAAQFTEVRDLRGRLDRALGQVEGLNASNDALLAQTAELAPALRATRERLTEKASEAENLAARLKAAETSGTVSQSELDALRSTLAKAKAAEETLRRQLAQAEDRARDAEGRLADTSTASAGEIQRLAKDLSQERALPKRWGDLVREAVQRTCGQEGRREECETDVRAALTRCETQFFSECAGDADAVQIVTPDKGYTARATAHLCKAHPRKSVYLDMNVCTLSDERRGSR